MKPYQSVPKANWRTPVKRTESVDESSSFDPAKHVIIAADSIEQLRGQDVDRLFDETSPKNWKALADYIVKHRPDLRSKVNDRLDDEASVNSEDVGEATPNNRQPSVEKVKSLIPKFVKAAQHEYDSWNQDEEGYDEEMGVGGICDRIADAFVEILSKHGVHQAVTFNSSMGTNHTWVFLLLREGVYELDIPPGVYETGGGYNWKKKKNVRFDANDVVLNKISSDVSPKEFHKNYADNGSTASDREAAQAYRENPGDSSARAKLTAIAGMTIGKGKFKHLHPGEIPVYRAGSVSKKGTSFTKSLAEAHRQLFVDESKITKLQLKSSDPAIDINKLDPGSRYSKEREVFVDTRNIDRSRYRLVPEKK